MLTVDSSGSYEKTEKFLKSAASGDIFSKLDRWGRVGVDALSRATPVDTGLAASSWGYRIESTRDSYAIHWFNDDVEGGANVALLIQYDHGTGTGGFVPGRDYINPAMKPIFDKMEEEVLKEVSRG